jgi:hypothetical protein
VTHDSTLAARASRVIRLLDGAVVEDTGSSAVADLVSPHQSTRATGS